MAIMAAIDPDAEGAPRFPQATQVGAGERASRSRVVAAAVLLVVVTCVVYAPSLGGGFLLDDNVLLTENPLIQAADGVYKFWFTTEAIDYWPVTNTSFWLEWRLWGDHASGYRVTNLILHITAALLIWLTLWRLAIPGAFVAALLFAVHPVNVESVAWIAQRKNLLALLFALISVLAFLSYLGSPRSAQRPTLSHPNSKLGWYGVSLVAFILAMLSKGSVAILPVVLAGLTAWLRPPTTRDAARLAPFFLVSLVLVPVNILFQSRVTSPVPGPPLLDRLLAAAAILWFYLGKGLLPLQLSFIYPKWQVMAGELRWWLPLAALLATTALMAWCWRRGQRALPLASLFYAVALLPVMGFTGVGFMEHSPVADHYQHVALIGLLALLAAAWSSWRSRAQGALRYALSAGGMVVVGVLTLLTWQQSRLYADAATLYQATLRHNPGSWLMHNNLGLALWRADRPLPEAIEHFAEAARLNPEYPEAQNNLGFALLQSGRRSEAMDHLRQALRINPQYGEAHYNLAGALLPSAALDEAIEHFRQAARLRPHEAEYHYSLGSALAQRKELDAARASFERALQIKPDYAQAHNDLGATLFAGGRSRDAVTHYEQALLLQPDFVEAHYNLATALLQADQLQAAIEHFQHAVRLRPGFAHAHNDLGVALTGAGQLREAIEHFEEALRLDPADHNARSNLEETRAMQEKGR